MPVPKYGLISTGAPGGQVRPEVQLGGVTELRVHGVGGTPPEALLNDLAPQQVAGDSIAGFYRTADQLPPSGTASRHVEGYSWGGLTSRSSWRVFWLLLLPFLLGNLAGWMCSVRTKDKGPPTWRFLLHRASVSLACLALTVNLILVTAMITADIAAYQAVRAGAANGRWWLAPLRWPTISGHPARQVLLGMALPAVAIILLAVLAARSRSRYEQVRPPYRVPPQGEAPSPPPRALTVAAALEDGLSDEKFWDGEHSVQHSSRRHISASLGFLALMLAITSKDAVVAANGHVNAAALWWAALIGGGAVVAFVIFRTSVDFRHRGSKVSDEFAKKFDDWFTIGVRAVAIAAICCAGIFAWLQPAVSTVAGQLPGMAGIFGWTMTVFAVILGLVLLSSAVGGWNGGTLLMGPLVTMILAFSLLNVTMFGGMLSLAHLLGNLAFAATPQASQIYVPEIIGFGTPAAVIAALAAVLVFGIAEFVSWERAGGGHVKKAIEEQYGVSQEAAQAMPNGQSQPSGIALWECSALDPPKSDGRRHEGKEWAGSIARAQRIGRASRDAGWLLWALALFEIAAVVVTLTAQPSIAPDRWYGKAAITLATFLPLFLIGLLRAGWGQQDRRRQIGVLWDVGTFWPRSYHPLAPPCYAERAVPDLQRRLWWIHDNHGRVLLAGHSQGSVLAAAALIQPKCLPEGNRTALATFGCPLGKLYSWGFPAYVNEVALGGIIYEGSPGWLNFYYPTDPIAGRVFADEADSDHDNAQAPTGQQGRKPQVDVYLLDPEGIRYNYGQPKPVPGGHSGYWTDPRVWDQIAELANALPEHQQPELEPQNRPA